MPIGRNLSDLIFILAIVSQRREVTLVKMEYQSQGDSIQNSPQDKVRSRTNLSAEIIIIKAVEAIGMVDY